MTSNTQISAALVREKVQKVRHAPDTESPPEFVPVELNESELPPPPQLDEDDEAEEVSKREIKKRKSSIALDYNPGPTPFVVPDGLERAELRCWVDRRLVAEVDASDLLQPDLLEEDLGVQERKLLFLAQNIVSVKGEFHVRQKYDGQWVQVPRKDIVGTIIPEYGYHKTDLNISQNCIDDFLQEKLYPVINGGTMYVPGASTFVRHAGKTFLNTYYQPVMAYRSGASSSTGFDLLFELIVRNLLNVRDGDQSEWLTAIEASEPSDIKWFFHWLASQYRRQGKFPS